MNLLQTKRKRDPIVQEEAGLHNKLHRKRYKSKECNKIILYDILQSRIFKFLYTNVC